VVALDEEHFDREPPVAVRFGTARGAASEGRPKTNPSPGESRPPTKPSPGEQREVAVVLEGELTPVGTLDLACVDVADAGRRFQLAFTLRGQDGEAERMASSVPPRRSMPPAGPISVGGRRLEEAIRAIDQVYGRAQSDADGRGAKDLLRELERILGDR